MDSPDWRAAVARAKRLGIEAYQAGRVKFDPGAATTVLVERVTSNEPWGPTSKDCAAIAELTYDAVEAPRVMEVIWRRLNGDAAAGPKNWRKVHKTLALLDFLIKHAAVGVIDEASSHSMTFAALSRFSPPRAGLGGAAVASVAGADAEEGCRLVREKAAALLSLLDDTEALARCRAEAQRSAGRFVGIGRDALAREGGRRSLAFGSDEVAAPSRGVTIATAGGPREALGAAQARVRPFSLAGSSLGARGIEEGAFKAAYSPPSPTTDDAPAKPAAALKAAPAIAPPPASAFGQWTAARFASTSAPPAQRPPAQRPPAQSDPFADIFAGVDLISPAPAESAVPGGAANAGGGGDPFASLLDDVDERLSANKGASTEPLCAEAAVTWNVSVGGSPPIDAPDIGAALASASAPAATAAPGDAMDAFLFEEARRQLAAVQLPPATWGPGSSLSPRQPPRPPAAAPVFRAAPPPEPNLIDL